MICEKNKCTGCGACYNICPKNAIFMEEDEYGNIYPQIDKRKCINCSLCYKICPQLNESISYYEPIRAYAMYSRNQKTRSQSSSGAAATLFYESVIKNNGIVYGASNLFGKDDFEFIKIKRKNDLYKVKGSKYVHCYTKDIFKDVKKELEASKTVLFIGTPCQVAGLKSYLRKEYDNLICIDIICHGVPSQKLLFEELQNNGIKKENVNYISFRDEKKFNLKVIDFNNNVVLDKSADTVEYYRNFLEGNIYRDNCYSCIYAKRKRISDVTIGDFWGLNKNSKIYDDENKGISLIIQNTTKGGILIDSIKELSVIEERPLEEAYKGNNQLNHPATRNNKFDIYKKLYPVLGYEKTTIKMITLKDRIKRLIKKKSTIYKKYKKRKNKSSIMI